MLKFAQLLMKSLKLNFVEDSIKYEEYYFIGLPHLKNIEFSYINTKNFKLSWKIEDINILNIDKNKMKYI